MQIVTAAVPLLRLVVPSTLAWTSRHGSCGLAEVETSWYGALPSESYLESPSNGVARRLGAQPVTLPAAGPSAQSDAGTVGGHPD